MKYFDYLMMGIILIDIIGVLIAEPMVIISIFLVFCKYR